MTSKSQASATPTIAPHLLPYQAPPASYILAGGPQKISLNHLVVSAAVVHSDHILLLQRAAHEFQPLLWELPGGRCEPGDESVIASAARELREESGLVAEQVVAVVGKYEWLDHGELWRKVTFLVEVRGDEGQQPLVKIDPNEHASFVWVTEKDVIAGISGGTSLSWTSDGQKQMVLDAFDLVKSADLTK